MNSSQISRGRHRLLKGLGIAILVLFALWLYAFACNRTRIVRLDSIFDPAYGYSVEYREQYFASNFPSSNDINAYLSDSTILISHPSSGTSVYYFDKSHGFIHWRDHNLEAGKWWISPNLQIITLGNRWRVAVVYLFCTWFFKMEAIAQQENCYYVVSLDSIFARGSGSRRENRTGNIFNLAIDKQAPGRLPKSEITIDSLLAITSSSQRQLGD